MAKLLLIRPRGQEGFWDLSWITRKLVGDVYTSPPLGLATVAALTPDDWEIEIIDEYIDPIPQETDADIVGITGTNVEYDRQVELLDRFRRQGKHTVAGGPYVSLVPDLYRDVADTLVVGEAEYIWPQFCQEWPAVGRFYQQVGTVDLTHVPVPRFDLIDLDRYLYASVQFSRGCPFRCEFCDAIVIFGRKPRVKTNEQVARELDAIGRHGGRSVFFVDDNLIGHKPAAKALMRSLIGRHGNMTFGAEASLNLAQDPELMTLMREAQFEWVFSGIETDDIATLKAAGKHQNTRMPSLEAVRTMYAHGIQLYAGFIVGFDEDTTDVFQAQFDFIMESGIQLNMIGPLHAMPRTPLYERLKKAGRILFDHTGENTRDSNIIPLNMSREELKQGHAELYVRLYTDSAIATRIANKRRYLKDPVMRRYGGFGAARRLKKSLPHWARPIDAVDAADWSIGLSMQDYVRRNLNGSDGLGEVHLRR